MPLGLVTIQRNRGPWLVEWFAFHYLMGFRKFYFYAHMCSDNTVVLLEKLSKKFDITALVIGAAQNGIQLAASQHACENYMNDVDWMCFLDGDEFIYPTSHNTLSDALAPYAKAPISALGVYNRNFGSSGHIEEPQGLITENFRMRANDNFMAQRRVKSFVKGRQKVSASQCSNVFITPQGTVDELMRPITWGYMPEYVPSYTQFCFNHYVCQSHEYFLSFKKHSGHADANSSTVREDEWWDNFDTNEVYDDSLTRFASPLRELVTQIHAELNITPFAFSRIS